MRLLSEADVLPAPGSAVTTPQMWLNKQQTKSARASGVSAAVSEQDLALQKARAALFAAAEKGDVDDALAVLKAGRAAPNDLDGKGCTAMCIAARLGHEALVAALHGAGGGLEAPPAPDSRSPLLWAADAGRAEVVGLLLRLGARVGATDAGGFTALQ